MQWHITESHRCQILNKKNPNLQLLVRAVLQFICVLLLVLFFLLLFIYLVSISTLSVLSFCILFCLVLFFYRIWGISVALRSLGGMSGMFWFNTSLPELSFDRSINNWGFWGQSIGGYREMKQLGCKAGMRMRKRDSAAGIRKGGLWSACFTCKGMADKVMRFFKFWG